MTAVPSPPVAVPDGPLGLLVQAVAGLGALTPAELPGPVALQHTAITLREIEKLKAISLIQLADVHSRQLHTLVGAPSAGSWIEQQQVGVDRSLLALAVKLHRTPNVAGAVAGGVVSMPAAVLVAQALDKLRRHLDRPDGLIDGQDGELVLASVIVDGVGSLLGQDHGGYADDDPQLHALHERLTEIAAAPRSQLRRVEDAFLVLAEQVGRAALAGGLEQLVVALLPVQLEDHAERAHHHRGLKLTRKPEGAGWTISKGDLDPECGELLHTVITAARATDPDNPTDTAGWAAHRTTENAADRAAATAADDRGAAGDSWLPSDPLSVAEREVALGEPSAPAPRSRVQQDHDALKLALRRILDTAGLGVRDKTAPHLLITVPADTLHDQPGALPAVAASGAVLPASLARRLLCDSRLSRVVLSLGHRVLEISHSERTLKTHERHALTLQWGGRCAGAGCPTPLGTPLIPHHATPWHLTGSTSLTDSIPLCETTHHDLHEGRKTIRLRNGRYLTPTGWTDDPSG